MMENSVRFVSIALHFLVLLFLSTSTFAVVNPWYQGLSYVERGIIDLPVYGGARVNTYTGNLGIQRGLFVIPGRGLPVELYLTYNSDHRLISSPFGYGWGLSYHIRYQKDSSGNVTIVWGDGRQDTFMKNDAGYTAPAGVYLDLTENASGIFTLTTKHGIKFIFSDPAHRKLTAIEDPNGNAITIAYDAAYRPVSIRDAGGREYVLVYDNGFLSKVEDANLATSRSYILDYDDQGRLTTITDPLGQQERFAYDGDNLLTAITDKKGNTTTIVYATPVAGAVTRLPQSISKDTRSTGFAFDAVTSTTTYTDANGNEWQFKYASPISKIIDPAEKATVFSWDSNKNLTSIVDRNGNTTTITYDAQGNPLTVEDALGNEIQLVYGSLGRVKQFTDRRGKSWTHTYDAAGNPIQTTDPAGNKMTRAFDGAGQMTGRTDRTGNTHTFAYDDNGNLVSWTDPLGNTTQFAYDGASRLTQVTDPNGNTVGLSYDALDRLLGVTDGAGNADQRTYDANGNLIRYRDRMGAEWSLSYNVWGELTQTVGPSIPDPNNPSTQVDPTVSLTRDANGNVTQVVDPLGNAWVFGYDPLNRLVQRKDPLGNTWGLAYDPEGNLTRLTDALGHDTTYTYDPLDRLVQQRFTHTGTASFTYDPEGNLLTARDGNSHYVMVYDNLGRLVQFSDNILGKAFSYAYDAEGRLTGKTYPGGESLTFTYDAAGRRAEMTTPNGITIYGYDPAGNLNQITYHSGHSSNITYDANNRVSRIEHKMSGNITFASYTYTRDANGRIIRSEREGQNLVAEYTYDPYGRVTREVLTDNFANPSTTTTLVSTYDPAGNLVAYTRGGTTGTVTWDVAGRPQSDSAWMGIGATFTYDANGQRTQIDIGGFSQSLTYDSRQRLVSVDGFDYTYDVFNRLIRVQGTGVDQRFLYGDPFSSMPNEIYDGNDDVRVKYYKNMVHMLPAAFMIEYVNRRLISHLVGGNSTAIFLEFPLALMALLPKVQYLVQSDFPIPQEFFRFDPNNPLRSVPMQRVSEPWIDPVTGVIHPGTLVPDIQYLVRPDFRLSESMARMEVQIPSTNPSNSTGQDVHIHPLAGDLAKPEDTSIFTGPVDPISGGPLPFDVKIGDEAKKRSVRGAAVPWEGLQPPLFVDWQPWIRLPGCYEPLEPSGSAICGGGGIIDRENGSGYQIHGGGLREIWGVFVFSYGAGAIFLPLDGI